MSLQDDLDDLDDLLDDQPLVVDEAELLSTDPVPKITDEQLSELVTVRHEEPVPVASDPNVMKEFEEHLPDVSLITEKGSSLLLGPRRRIRFKDLAKLDLRNNPVKWARHLTADTRAQDLGHNPIDKLSEAKIFELTAALQQCEAKILEGYEASIILAAPGAEFRGKPLGDVDRLTLHLNAMGIDQVAILKLHLDTQKLRRGLLQRGLREGSDYEFLEPNNLLPYERAVFDRMLSQTTSRLRLVRKLSKQRANM